MPESPLLRHAAQRAAARPFFLAALLLPYARRERWDDDALARALGCPPERLPALLLCRQPAEELPAFRADVRRIAEHFGIPADTLAETVRLARALQALEGVAEGTAGSDLLAAARDREPVDQDQP